MCENISFVKSAVGFGLQNFDPTWILSLCSSKYQTHSGKYLEKGLEKCIPVLSTTVSLPSEHCPVLWISLGPSLWRVCTWHCGAEPCSISFMS